MRSEGGALKEPDSFEETPRKDFISSPGDVFRIIWRRLWTIVLVAVVLTGSALAFSLAQTPTYEASILIVVGQKSPAKGERLATKDIVDPDMLVATVARAVDTRPVAEGVVKRLNLPGTEVPEVMNNMNVAADPGTTFIQVSYRDSDPRQAQRIANTIGEAFSKQVSELNVTATPITARVWQQAALPETPANPKPLLLGGLALVVGTLLGTMLAFVFEYLDSGEAPRKK